MHTLTRERQQDAESEALDKSAAMLSGELLAALRHGDLTAPALFAPTVTDWRAPFAYLDSDQHRDKRLQTVGEVVIGQLSGTQDFDALTQLVVQLAYGVDDRSVMAEKARNLLNSIATDFGDNNANSETE